MKQQILHFLLIVILSMAYPFSALGNDNRIIDFNYPQEVSKEALADLDNALKSGDGELTVDALVRYSIAQSGISKDNMPVIVKRLESTIAKEKQPHIKALLYYFEALVYQGYSNRYARWSNRNNPVEETPADVSEWDRRIGQEIPCRARGPQSRGGDITARHHRVQRVGGDLCPDPI